MSEKNILKSVISKISLKIIAAFIKSSFKYFVHNFIVLCIPIKYLSTTSNSYVITLSNYSYLKKTIYSKHLYIQS